VVRHGAPRDGRYPTVLRAADGPSARREPSVRRGPMPTRT